MKEKKGKIGKGKRKGKERKGREKEKNINLGHCVGQFSVNQTQARIIWKEAFEKMPR